MTIDESTKEWLKDSWNITIEENDKNLKKIENKELIFVFIGCDTGTRRIQGCFDNHKKYERTSSSGWVSSCKVCDKALEGLKVTTVYVPEHRKIEYFLNTEEVNKRIDDQIKIQDKIIEETNKERERKKQEIENEKGNKTVVHVQRNLEYGTWRIIGGAKGRLEYNVFIKAKNEMNEAFNRAMKGYEGQLLASKPQPEQTIMKHFDLVTENFVYRIVDDIFEE